MRQADTGEGWAVEVVAAAQGLPISIDGPESVWGLGPNVYRKVTSWQPSDGSCKVNVTAVCSRRQIPKVCNPADILSVFAGRIMDTGRDPQPVIDAAKATGAQVLWASVREPYNILQAEAAGCDIVTVPPAILRKWLDWHGKPLEVVAAETIAQFDRDREGLW
jgi:transaldolase